MSLVSGGTMDTSRADIKDPSPSPSWLLAPQSFITLWSPGHLEKGHCLFSNCFATLYSFLRSQGYLHLLCLQGENTIHRPYTTDVKNLKSIANKTQPSKQNVLF